MAADDQVELAAVTERIDRPAATWPVNAVRVAPVRRRWPRTLGRLLGFFSVVAVLFVILQVTITAGLRRITTSDFGVSNRIADGQINADIVITGSSRALVHYDPRVIREVTGLTAYNLGRNGSQTDLQVAVLKWYLRHNAKPKLVIHNLDLYSFTTSHEIYDPGQYLPYLDEPAIYAAVRRVYPDAWKWKYLPLYGYAVVDMRFTWLTGLRGLVGLNPPEDHVDGFVPRNLRWTGAFEAFRSDHRDGVRTPIERQGIRDVEDLLTLCRRSGIPVVLVYSPEYAPVQRLEINRRAIFHQFSALARRYHVPLWDYSASAIAADRALFYNSQHLNARGAERFSIELADRLAASPLLAATVDRRTAEANGSANSLVKQP